MTGIASSLAAALLYLTAAGLQYREFKRDSTQLFKVIVVMGSVALAFHAFSISRAMVDEGGINFGFFKVSSLIFLIITAATLLSLVRRPLQNLLVIVFPLAAVSVLVSYLGPGTRQPFAELDSSMLLHIGLSVAAYGVLTCLLYTSDAADD